MPEYPKREPFHAHKLTRLLFKSCAIQDIGHNAALLIVHIAHTEDAARYQYPVRFWNGQLMNVMGWHSPKQLTDARRKAVEAGWLYYERDHDRAVGRYWTLIPPTVTAFNDEPIEPSFISVSGNGIHSDSGTGNGKHSDNGTHCGIQSGTGSGIQSGKPSIPDPVPDPRERQRKLPPSLDTDKFRFAWTEFLEHLQHRHGQAMSAQWIETNLMDCMRRGHDKAIRDIRFSIEKNARTLLDGSKRFDGKAEPAEPKMTITERKAYEMKLAMDARAKQAEAANAS
jgi:hypothetical protein